MSIIETVQSMYAAFGRGDVPFILGKLAPDVVWEYGSADNPVPWFVKRRGPDEVMKFFQSLAEVEFHRFEPTDLLAGKDVVVALVTLEATVKSTGKRVIEQDYAHVWRFDAAGRVARFRHCSDTWQHAQACMK